MTVWMWFALFFAVLAIVWIVWIKKYFRPCGKCRSRLTTFSEGFTPDFYKSWERPHHWWRRRCHKCGHIEAHNLRST